MEDKKVKAGSVAVGICLFIIAILLVLIVVFFYNTTMEKNNLQAKVSELEATIEENGIQSSISENNSDSKLQIPSVYVADTKNLVKGVNYDLGAGDGYFHISTRNNKITVTFSKDEKELKQLANSLKIDEKDIKVEPHKGIEVTGFSKKVIDVEMGCIGQDITSAIFVFLMEDGTVEYSDVKNMITKVNTQGKIEGLKDIIRIQNVDVWAPEDSGHVSMIAIDKDNVCYDISDYINNEEDDEETSTEDIVLDGMYSFDDGEYGSDIIWNFSKDGKAAVGGNMFVYQGTYKTIRENYIEVHYIKHKIWDDETNKETVKTIDEYEYISIEDNNIYLTDSNGQKSKIKRFGDVVSENFE